MTTFLLVCYLAGWALIPTLLLRKKRPTATLAWLWAILFIPIAGACAFLVFGTDRMKRRRRKRRHAFAARTVRTGRPAAAAETAAAELAAALPPRERRLLQSLSRLNDLPVSAASAIRVLHDAKEFYPALEARIRAARHHIHLEFYIWQDDPTGRHFLRLLTAAAQRGAIVRLLLDGVGSHGFAEDLLADFRRAGGQFSWFQSLDPRRNRFFLNLRNHRKLQVFDGTVAFVGGMNIGRDCEGGNPALGPWRDVQAEVTGTVAADLQEVFADDWFFATGSAISAPEYYPADGSSARHAVHLVLGGPDRDNEPVAKSFANLLNEAEERVWIATGYFVPDDVILTALELAAARGVDVRLLVPCKLDHPWLVHVGRSYYGQLLAAGVRIFEYTAGLYHAKVVLADRQWTMVGSANLDYRSMRLNFELGLLLHSAARNADLARRLAEDFADCREIEAAAFARRPFRQKLAEAALRPLSPLL